MLQGGTEREGRSHPERGSVGRCARDIPKMSFSVADSSFLWTPGGPADKWIGILTYEIYHDINPLMHDHNNATMVHLEKANERYPEQPAILVRLAQKYILLDDPIGAYLCAQHAHSLIVGRIQQTDSQLATWVQFLHNRSQTHIHEQSCVVKTCAAPF